MRPRTTKRRKTEQEKYLCSSCDTERISTSFPDYNPSADCQHLINTCKTCLKKWIDAQIDSSNFATGPARDDGTKAFGIKCPECDAIMLNVNIETSGVSKKTYADFVERERKFIRDNTPGWRWCMAPECNAGHIHESKPTVVIVEEVVTQTEAEVNKRGKAEVHVESKEIIADIFECNECGAKACVGCNRPWHDRETCEEYQARTKGNYEEEDRTLREIQKVTKRCPGCKANVQKNGGCTNMSCSQCRSSFCWTCLTEFERGSYSGYCLCHPRPPTPPVVQEEQQEEEAVAGAGTRRPRVVRPRVVRRGMMQAPARLGRPDA